MVGQDLTVAKRSLWRREKKKGEGEKVSGGCFGFQSLNSNPASRYHIRFIRGRKLGALGSTSYWVLR